MEAYLNLLHTFGVKNQVDELLETSSYVSMDNIHDAIIDTGVNMDMPLNFYIVSAKQAAIDEYRARVRQKRIRDEKSELFITTSDEWDWNQYGFTPVEIEVVKEWIGGITLDRSKFTKRQRQKYRTIIKGKVIRLLMSN